MRIIRAREVLPLATSRCMLKRLYRPLTRLSSRLMSTHAVHDRFLADRNVPIASLEARSAWDALTKNEQFYAHWMSCVLVSLFEMGCTHA